MDLWLRGKPWEKLILHFWTVLLILFLFRESIQHSLLRENKLRRLSAVYRSSEWKVRQVEENLHNWIQWKWKSMEAAWGFAKVQQFPRVSQRPVPSIVRINTCSLRPMSLKQPAQVSKHVAMYRGEKFAVTYSKYSAFDFPHQCLLRGWFPRLAYLNMYTYTFADIRNSRSENYIATVKVCVCLRWTG